MSFKSKTKAVASRGGVALAAAAMAIAAMPAIAMADGEDASSVINSITDTLNNDILMPIFHGILAVVASVALIFLVKEIIQAALSPAGMQKNQHITQCVVILFACLLLMFAPNIINWIFNLGAGNGAEATIPTVNVTGK